MGRLSVFFLPGLSKVLCVQDLPFGLSVELPVVPTEFGIVRSLETAIATANLNISARSKLPSSLLTFRNSEFSTM